MPLKGFDNVVGTWEGSFKSVGILGANGIPKYAINPIHKDCALTNACLHILHKFKEAKAGTYSA